LRRLDAAEVQGSRKRELVDLRMAEHDFLGGTLRPLRRGNKRARVGEHGRKGERGIEISGARVCYELP
jgi:hypothetical protein